MPERLRVLAERAGLTVDWQDAHGRSQRLRPDVLRSVLHRMRLPADTPADIDHSLAQLDADALATRPPALLLGDVDTPLALPWLRSGGGSSYTLVTPDGQTIAAGRLGSDAQGMAQLPPQRAWGEHALRVDGHEVPVAFAPRRCFGVADAVAAARVPAGTSRGMTTERAAPTSPDDQHPQPRLWGIAMQLYGLRDDPPPTATAATQRLGGLGDFGTLARCCTAASAHGAATVLINPVHAAFAAAPDQYSPYAPSNRQFLNPLYADPAVLFGTAAVSDAVAALGLAPVFDRLAALPEVDWPANAAARDAVLRRLYADRRRLLDRPALDDLAAFERAGGAPLRDHACFESLHRHHRGRPWRTWPDDQRRPTGVGTHHHAATHADEVGFHVFAQWLAARSLAAAQAQARAAGMPIGLLGDLAVGADPNGSQAWSLVDDLFDGLQVGAPPDINQPHGQGWGLTAFDPRALRRNGYRAYRDLLRATMGPLGGVRIDHALGLQRLWLIPEGAGAADGAYLRYPLDDLMRLIKLASWQHRSIVIGENLGTVPPGFDQRIADAGMLGTSVLWFERGADDGAFRPPSAWSAAAVATTTTHDLPTVAGWWSETDIAWQVALGLLPDAEAERHQRQRRAEDRTALAAALVAAGVDAHGAASGPISDGDAGAEAGTDLPAGHPAAASTAPVDAAIGCVCAAAAPLALLPIEDLLGLVEQPNLPGTTAGHPNWRRRLPLRSTPLFDDPEVARRIAIARAARPPH